MALIALAFAAGALATVDPCSLALLPAFVSLCSDHRCRQRRPVRSGVLRDGLTCGAAVSAGFASVYLLAGLLAVIGLRSLVERVPWLSVAVGVAIAAVGLARLTSRRADRCEAERRSPPDGRIERRLFAFGAGYAATSMSCMLSVLLAVVAQATAVHAPMAVLGVFAAHAAGSATVLIAATMSTVATETAVLSAVDRLLPMTGRVAGAVLIASGAYLALR